MGEGQEVEILLDREADKATDMRMVGHMIGDYQGLWGEGGDGRHAATDFLEQLRKGWARKTLSVHLPSILHAPHALLSATRSAMVGALGYLMNCTRPDIAFVMSRVAQFTSCPTTKHLAAVKHIFRYIKGTTETKLGGSENPLVIAYFDSSFADDRDDSRSTYGYAILYGGSTMVWKSKKHKAVNLWLRHF